MQSRRSRTDPYVTHRHAQARPQNHTSRAEPVRHVQTRVPRAQTRKPRAGPGSTSADLRPTARADPHLSTRKLVHHAHTTRVLRGHLRIPRSPAHHAQKERITLQTRTPRKGPHTTCRPTHHAKTRTPRADAQSTCTDLHHVQNPRSTCVGRPATSYEQTRTYINAQTRAYITRPAVHHARTTNEQTPTTPKCSDIRTTIPFSQPPVRDQRRTEGTETIALAKMRLFLF